jgi:hypothetical protein
VLEIWRDEPEWLATVKIGEALRNAIDWEKVLKLVDVVGDDLDDHHMRFTKAQIFEKSLPAYCKDGSIVRVSAKGNPIDHIFTLNGEKITIQQKYMKNIIWNKKGDLKESLQSINIKNTHGKKKFTTLPDDFPDCLLLITQCGVGIVLRQTLKDRGIKPNIDGGEVYARYYANDVYIIYGYNPNVKGKSIMLIGESYTKLEDAIINSVE